MTEEWGISPAAATLHSEAIVCDMVWPLEPWCGNEYGRLSDFARAGVNMVSITVAGDNHDSGEAFRRVAAARHHILAMPEQFVLVENSTDIAHVARGGKLGIGFHFEGTRCFERDLHLVEAFYRLGVRHTLLAFNQANSVGGGCAEKRDGGLTRFGTQLVCEMNRVGMVVDLSHTGHRTTLDAMDVSDKPVLFSHSNSATVHSHFRNLKDDQVDACAATGGVIGVSSSSEYLGVREPSAAAIFRHLDYYVQRVGPEHVGLGLDIVFDPDELNAWIRTRPAEWPGTDSPEWPGFRYAVPAVIPVLTELMLTHGYSPESTRGILGENYLRVCRANWT